MAFATPTPASAADPTIEAIGSYGFSWSPSSAEVAPGGSVVFKSSSGIYPHGVTWKSGPETPQCAGVPIDEGKTSWSGSCAFATAGAYSFICYVHPEMIGKVTAGSGATPVTPPPGSPGSPGSPGDGPVLKSLKLARSQQGKVVNGSVEISQSGVGSRLLVELYAARAALLKPGTAGRMLVGAFKRPSVAAGVSRFKARLSPIARKALLADGRLDLRVKILIVTPEGERTVRTREVTLRV
jgi:plastocyanin